MLLAIAHCLLCLHDCRQDSALCVRMVFPQIPCLCQSPAFSGEHAIRLVDFVILISSHTMNNPHSAAQSLVTCLLRLYLHAIPSFEKHPILSASPSYPHNSQNPKPSVAKVYF